mmetsp:Transcript_29595/g.68822  ORF Transcript_29595/g.68822 Transcript_29595/m.68822 type:complete len:223 (-) Transcript_29595:70-738(-)
MSSSSPQSLQVPTMKNASRDSLPQPALLGVQSAEDPDLRVTSGVADSPGASRAPTNAKLSSFRDAIPAPLSNRIFQRRLPCSFISVPITPFFAFIPTNITRAPSTKETLPARSSGASPCGAPNMGHPASGLADVCSTSSCFCVFTSSSSCFFTCRETEPCTSVLSGAIQPPPVPEPAVKRRNASRLTGSYIWVLYHSGMPVKHTVTLRIIFASSSVVAASGL